jgi:predicted RND superfamily exporter protein
MQERSVMRSFADFILRFRWIVFLIILAVSGVLGYLSMSLPTNNDYETWLPEKDRVTVLWKETDREFSSNALIFVVLAFPEDGVFHPDSLAQVRRFTELFESVPELFFVMSLTNIVDIRAIEDGVSVDDLIREIPRDPEAMAGLKDYVLSKEMYVDAVVSRDARHTVILMNIDGDYDEVAAASNVLKLLEENAGGVSYYFGGDPALGVYSDLYMQKDMERLVPLMFVVMTVILGFGLRRFWGVVLPLVTVMLSILWTLGFQRIFDMPLNLLTPAVLVMLIAMGSDYAVHSINHYLKSGDVGRAGAEISVPIIMSAITTIAGLLTFGTTKIRVLQDFGFELAFGLGSACFLTVTFLIVMLRILRPKPESLSPQTSAYNGNRPKAGEASEKEHIFGRFLEALTVLLLRHTRLFFVGVVLVIVVMGLGFFRIHTNVDFVTIFPEESEPRVGHEILRDHFSGIYPVSIYFRGDIEEPSLLMMQLRMENYLRSNPQLSSFSSLGATIAEMNRLLTGTYAIPETRAGVAGLWLLMEGEPYLKPLVNDVRDKALVTAMIRDSATDVMKGLAGFVDESIPLGEKDEILTLDPARLAPEGRVRVLQLRIEDAARQLAALTAFYSKGKDFPPSYFLQRIQGAWENVLRAGWSPGIENALKNYLRTQAIGGEDPTVEARILEAFRNHFPQDPPEGWTPKLREGLSRQKGLDARDAQILEEGALWLCRETFRNEKVDRLDKALFSGLPDAVQGNPDFERRVRGVLWELVGNRPVFLRSACSSVSGLDSAVIKRVPVELDQTGAPTFFRKFDELLFKSQSQSLLLASAVVFLLVSITQRSLRRGVVSILAVLVPLEIVIGLMGWLGIPLDFGTALFGALIIGLGIDGCIHILHYEAGLNREGLTEEQALVRTLRHVGRAVLTANVTTAGGFAVLIFSATDMVKNFAVVNVLAISLVTASILTLLPVLIKVSHLFAGPTGNAKNRDP